MSQKLSVAAPSVAAGKVLAPVKRRPVVRAHEPRRLDSSLKGSIEQCNMCGTVMRGADALPGSKATSRAKGSHRNLGGLGSGRQMLRERDGPHREGEDGQIR